MNTKDLPVWRIVPEILASVRQGRNVVVTAPPGSGKTTQVPQALLDSGLVNGTILVVQPRRLACRMVAQRVAQERGGEVGREVGYMFRDEAKRSPDSRLLFVTDGVLLRLIEDGFDRQGVGAVVFDEFHERRASVDVALGLLKAAQARRPSLRLAVMSATMECGPVIAYLDADLHAADGRQHPVDVGYAPHATLDEAVEALPALLRKLHQTEPQGDVLVFLPGKEEIRRVKTGLEKLAPIGLVACALHGETGRDAQDAAFRPVIGRKVILATNIAETSLTVPGVRIVVDSGYERRSEFDADLGIDRLALTAISGASADQRAGRAGREAPGRCLRLWSAESHERLVPQAPSEIMRTDLSSVVMTLKALGILDPGAFDLLERPEVERLAAAEGNLSRLGAVGADRRLTPIGWRMHRLPLPPRYARMVVESERNGCTRQVAGIAALMSGRPVFMPDRERRKRALETVRDDGSDFFALLELFWQARKNRFAPEWCEARGLSPEALQEAVRLEGKVVRIVRRRGPAETRGGASREAVRRCILSGLTDRIAVRESGGYRLANGLVCKTDEASAVRSALVVVADVHLPMERGATHEPSGRLSYMTAVDAAMLRQAVPGSIETVRIPLALDRANDALSVLEETRCQQALVESRVTQVDVVAAIAVTAEQRLRAERNGWKRVDVMPGIGRRSHVTWRGRTLDVTAESAGPHWAEVDERGGTPRIALRERIVPLHETERRAPVTPSALDGRITKSAASLAKLLRRD